MKRQNKRNTAFPPLCSGLFSFTLTTLLFTSKHCPKLSEEGFWNKKRGRGKRRGRGEGATLFHALTPTRAETLGFCSSSSAPAAPESSMRYPILYRGAIQADRKPVMFPCVYSVCCVYSVGITWGTLLLSGLLCLLLGLFSLLSLFFRGFYWSSVFFCLACFNWYVIYCLLMPFL